jgi:hypothetical protein
VQHKLFHGDSKARGGAQFNSGTQASKRCINLENRNAGMEESSSPQLFHLFFRNAAGLGFLPAGL